LIRQLPHICSAATLATGHAWAAEYCPAAAGYEDLLARAADDRKLAGTPDPSDEDGPRVHGLLAVLSNKRWACCVSPTLHVPRDNAGEFRLSIWEVVGETGDNGSGMADEIAKLLLEKAGTFLERTEAIRTALSLGMPLDEIEGYLDWLDNVRSAVGQNPGEEMDED
jgi:hypothetical protein